MQERTGYLCVDASYVERNAVKENGLYITSDTLLYLDAL